MNTKPNKYYLLIICGKFLLLVLISCYNQNQPSHENEILQAKPIENKIDTNRLKFTSGIRSILEDSKGNIWFGSHQEGLAKFNGEELTYYTEENGLSDKQIRTIYEDENGIIWFEGGKGLSSFDGNKITKQTERNFESKNDWKLSKNSLWFKGDKATGYNDTEGKPGVYQYDGRKLSFKMFPIKPKVGEENYYSVTTPFVRGRNGSVWFGTYGAAIGYDGAKFTVIDNKFLELNEDTGFLHIRSLIEDSKGNLWIGNNGIGVFKYDMQKAINFTELYNLKKKDTGGNSLERVFSIEEDINGNIWFGTIESGVWRYDGNSIENFNEKNGLLSNQIWTIYKSKQGELWFGGADPSGVYQFNGNSFVKIY